MPELEEERFQSLVAVPVLGKRGDPIGAITLDTEAPREFTDAEVEFLVSSASLVAGAIENARLYDETRQRVGELEHLTELAEAVAAAETLDVLGPEVVRPQPRAARRAARPALPPRRRRGAAALRWSDPTGEDAPATIGLERARAGARPQRARAARRGVARRRRRAARRARRRGTRELDLARAVANQAAVAIKKIQVLERLAEKNLIKDFFEDLAAQRPATAIEGRAARLGCDLDRPHVVIAAGPSTTRSSAPSRSLGAWHAARPP